MNTNTHPSHTRSHAPAGGEGAVEPERVLPVLGPVFHLERRDVKHRQAVVYVTFHTELIILPVGVHVHEPRDHIRGEGHDECLEKPAENNCEES